MLSPNSVANFKPKSPREFTEVDFVYHGGQHPLLLALPDYGVRGGTIVIYHFVMVSSDYNIVGLQHC